MQASTHQSERSAFGTVVLAATVSWSANSIWVTAAREGSAGERWRGGGGAVGEGVVAGERGGDAGELAAAVDALDDEGAARALGEDFVAEIGEGVVLRGGGAAGLNDEDDIAELDVLKQRRFAAPVDGGGVFAFHRIGW